MMLLSHPVASRLATRRFPAAMAGRTFSTLGNQLSKKEKVEEDLFMRAQTTEQLEKIRQDATNQAMAAQAKKDAKMFEEQLRPAMNEVKALLRTSENLSDQTVERIAKWHFGI